MTLTHKELCELGRKWLLRPNSRSGPGCQLALREVSCSSGGESPDAIGWRFGNSYDCGSYVVEAKTSRADFHADKSKSFRADPDKGMGEWRYYICPEGIIQPKDLPHKWGLIWVGKRNSLKLIRGFVTRGWNTRKAASIAEGFKANTTQERNLLATALRRFEDPQKQIDLVRALSSQIRSLEKQLETTTKKYWLEQDELWRLRNETA